MSRSSTLRFDVVNNAGGAIGDADVPTILLTAAHSGGGKGRGVSHFTKRLMRISVPSMIKKALPKGMVTQRVNRRPRFVPKLSAVKRSMSLRYTSLGR